MKKLLLFLVSVFLFSSSYSFDLSFLKLTKLFQTKVSQIHFYNGLDGTPQSSLGVFVLKETEDLDTPIDIKLNYGGTTKTIKCNAQLRGYYANISRGDFMLPLSVKDNTTFIHVLNGSNVGVEGGFYTNCDGHAGYIFGNIRYKRNPSDTNYWFKLWAGFKYELKENTIDFNKGFVNSFSLVSGVKPVGFIYDENLGGVGFVGGKLSESVSEIQTAMMDQITATKGLTITHPGTDLIVNGINVGETDFHITVKSAIGVQGGYNLSDANFQGKDDKKYKLDQMGVNEGASGNISKKAYNIGAVGKFYEIKNRVKKNVESICRGRWETITNNLNFNGLNKLDKINCFKNDGSLKTITIKYDIGNDTPILIIKGPINVKIEKSMTGKGYLELYIDRGQLLINNSIDKQLINKNGDIGIPAVTSGAVIKGIYVVNGLIGGYNGGNSFKHKLYIQGTFTSLNTISIPKSNRVDYVDTLLRINDKDRINLTKVFSWRCIDGTGLGTDNVKCDDPADKWWQNAIIFTKKNYKSKLLK